MIGPEERKVDHIKEVAEMHEEEFNESEKSQGDKIENPRQSDVTMQNDEIGKLGISDKPVE
jgi:hypothetical protein